MKEGSAFRSGKNLKALVTWLWLQRWQRCISLTLTFTSKQADNAKLSEHVNVRNEDEQFHLHVTSQLIQLDSVGSKII